MRGRTAPRSVLTMRLDGLHVAQIGRRHGRSRRWARRVMLQDEFYCFGRPAWIGHRGCWNKLRDGSE
jgi:hypothetical protein